jgi:hypothetical protein
MTTEYLFKDEEGKSLIGDISDFFKNKKIFLKNNSNLVFVCGGNGTAHARSKFLAEMKQHEVQGAITNILAEDAYYAFTESNEYRFVNSSAFECRMADICFCVLIFLEAPGAIAELGLFSAYDGIAEKTFVIKDYEHQGNSFINTGPVHRIDSVSKFQHSLVLNGLKTAETRESDYAAILERIRHVLPRRFQREPYKFGPYSKLSALMQFFVALEVINLFTVLRVKDMKLVFEEVFGGRLNRDSLNMSLSLLKAAKYIDIILSLDETEYYSVSRRPEKISFFESEHKTSLLTDETYSQLQMRTYDYYQKHCPDIIRYLEVSK